MQRVPFLLTVVAAFSLGAGFTAAQAQKTSSAEVIADEENDVVRIVIDGQDIVVIGAAGLRINGNVEYTGTITDTNGAAANAP